MHLHTRHCGQTYGFARKTIEQIFPLSEIKFKCILVLLEANYCAFSGLQVK